MNKIACHVETLSLDDAAFERLVQAMHAEKGFVLLESTRRDAKQGRYSMLAWEPFALLRAVHGRVSYEHHGRASCVMAARTLDALERCLEAYQLERPVGCELPFLGGALGYLAYEAGAELEKLPQSLPDVTGAPHAIFGFYSSVVTLDHQTGEVFLSHFEPGDGTPVPSLEEVRRKVQTGAATTAAGRERVREQIADTVLRTDFEAAEYMEAVRRIKEYILQGDVYQVNMTQRFWVPMAGRTSWGLYERLRKINPAPFAGYLGFEGIQVLSSSPERFLRVQGREVETRPIKGTAPRGEDPVSDEANRAWLLGSAKNRAELAMIVDLMRNDLGRVCEVGSVHVVRYPELESYASVHQLVATVRGQLAADRGVVDLLRATFPGGSITGAPKIRAMEIIDELEKVRRSVYTGSIGFVGFDGASDFNIAIRTIVVAKGVAHAHAGGGIVIDSDEQAEYEESRLKAKNLLLALGVEEKQNVVGAIG